MFSLCRRTSGFAPWRAIYRSVTGSFADSQLPKNTSMREKRIGMTTPCTVLETRRQVLWSDRGSFRTMSPHSSYGNACWRFIDRGD